MSLTISSKGWVVIPAELRRKYKLEPGSKVHVVDYGGVLTIVPVVKDPITQIAGSLKGSASLTKALLDSRQEERKRER
jgi:AbrB family looped-hinge helix DNA binding protein